MNGKLCSFPRCHSSVCSCNAEAAQGPLLLSGFLAKLCARDHGPCQTLRALENYAIDYVFPGRGTAFWKSFTSCLQALPSGTNTGFPLCSLCASWPRQPAQGGAKTMCNWQVLLKWACDAPAGLSPPSAVLRVPMKMGPPGSTMNCSQAEQPASSVHASTFMASNVQPPRDDPFTATAG